MAHDIILVNKSRHALRGTPMEIGSGTHSKRQSDLLAENCFRMGLVERVSHRTRTPPSDFQQVVERAFGAPIDGLRTVASF